MNITYVHSILVFKVLENSHAGANGCNYPSAYPNGFIPGKSLMECASICIELGIECGGFNWYSRCSNSNCCQLCKENDSKIKSGVTAYLKNSFL